MHGAEIDELQAKQTAADAAASTRAWAERGALASEPSGDQELLDRARAASIKASESQVKADGAAAGLRAIESAERDATNAADSAATQVDEAIRRAMLAEVEGDFEAIEQAYATVAEAELRIRVVGTALKFGKVHGIPSGAFEYLLRRLDALKPRSPDNAQLRQLSRQWIEFARRLAVDPDAQLS
jgi:hypothetical protein